MPPPFFSLWRVHISSACLPGPFWVFLSHTVNLLLTDLASLVCHRALRILLSLFPPPCLGYRGKASHLASAWVFRIWIQVLVLVQEVHSVDLTQAMVRGEEGRGWRGDEGRGERGRGRRDAPSKVLVINWSAILCFVLLPLLFFSVYEDSLF